MALPYSKTLASYRSNVGPPGATVIYTVPAAKVAVIKSITLWTIGLNQLELEAFPAGLQQILLVLDRTGGSSRVPATRDEMSVALVAGEVIKLNCVVYASSFVGACVGGYELNAV